MIFDLRGKWLYSCCFILDTSSICSYNTQHLYSHLTLTPNIANDKVQVVQPYNSTHMATVGKNFSFIISERSDFHIIVNLQISVNTLFMRMLSIDEILLPSYMIRVFIWEGWHLMRRQYDCDNNKRTLLYLSPRKDWCLLQSPLGYTENI